MQHHRRRSVKWHLATLRLRWGLHRVATWTQMTESLAACTTASMVLATTRAFSRLEINDS